MCARSNSGYSFKLDSLPALFNSTTPVNTSVNNTKRFTLLFFILILKSPKKSTIGSPDHEPTAVRNEKETSKNVG